MLIAISQRQGKNKYNDNIDSLENNYVNYLKKFGISVVPIPNIIENLEEYLEKLRIKGVILSGGNNINPELYGSKRREDATISIQRDRTEKELLDFAIKKCLPLLGICRGGQFINVYFKGSLVENIKKETRNNHVATNHPIKIVDAKAQKILGADTQVNSYHGQGILQKNLSPELRSFAKAEDESIEGIYHPGHPIAGILWHPERKNPNKELNHQIINAFITGGIFWKR